MASGDTKTEALLNVLGNGGDASQYKGCCNTKSQSYILDAIDRIQNVEDEVEELKNNPDVVDIVDTYADLQAYDTQHLSNNDIIRVLADETHSGNSTYYRFNKSAGTWTFIGEISGGGGGVKDLTAADLDFPVDNPSGVALWNLGPGTYRNASENEIYLCYSSSQSSQRKMLRAGDVFTVLSKRDYSGTLYTISQVGMDSYNNVEFIYANGGGLGAVLDLVSFKKVANDLTTTSSGQYALDAVQGKVLNDRIGDLSTLTTTATTSAVAAINEIAQGSGMKELGSDKYNFNYQTGDQTEPYNCVALWLLSPGWYYADMRDSGNAPIIYTDIGHRVYANYTASFLVTPGSQQNSMSVIWFGATDSQTGATSAAWREVYAPTGYGNDFGYFVTTSNYDVLYPTLSVYNDLDWPEGSPDGIAVFLRQGTFKIPSPVKLYLNDTDYISDFVGIISAFSYENYNQDSVIGFTATNTNVAGGEQYIGETIPNYPNYTKGYISKVNTTAQ